MLNAPAVAKGTEDIFAPLRTERARPRPPMRFSAPVEAAIADLVSLLREQPQLAARWPARWLAIKLIEHDAALLSQLNAEPSLAPCLEHVVSITARLAASTGEDADLLIASERYAWINRLVHATVHVAPTGPSLTERIDRLVTHRLLGLPIFLLIMFMLFRFTGEIPRAYVAWLDAVISGPITHVATAALALLGLNGAWPERLVLLGVLPGVGAVLAFVPVLLALYLGLGLLEDSGYMARAAFVIDRLMHALGLHGKSFIPMIVGFGCSVPGLYATRTLESRHERVLTGLLVPFMSCSARLPVYVLITAVFFPRQAGLVIFGLYLTGILLAMLIGLALNHTLFRRLPPAALIMELPAYHAPTWRNMWTQTWERTSGFIRKAGGTILTCSVIVWLLMAVPARGAFRFSFVPVQDSLFAAVARRAAPIFAPLGFDSWQSTGALMTGIVAKEVIISTIAQAYAGSAVSPSLPAASLLDDLRVTLLGFAQATLQTARTLPLLVGLDVRGADSAVTPDTSLMASIRGGLVEGAGGSAPLAALAFLVFVLLYTPCVSALTVARHELGLKWMAVSAVGQFAVAWFAGAFIFQAGSLLI